MPKIIPFGNNMLVKRRKVGDKAGSLFVPDSVKERDTDIADVLDVPNHTSSDKFIIEHSDDMIKAITKKIALGDSTALGALLELNNFLKIKSIKKGDIVFVGKYVGTTFFETGSTDEKTLIDGRDIIGLVAED